MKLDGSASAISIIMPCYNRATDLPRVLLAYDQQTTDEPFELIAVDDASPDSTFEVLSAYRPTRYRLRVMRQELNQGPSAARNRALAEAASPLVLFVGDDVCPEPNCIAEHLRLHRKYPEIGQAILGRVAWPQDMPLNTLMAHIDGVGAQQFSFHYLKDGHDYDFRHMYTANVSLKRALVTAEDHWFDSELRAFEDGEFAYRLLRRGLRIIYSSKPTMRHYHYHTVWSFSERHYWCATILPIFNRKHPEARVLTGRMPTWLARFRRPLVAIARWAASRKPALQGAHCWLEATALELASYYEWMPNSLLDRLYQPLLRYFWRKGIIDGTITRAEQAGWVHNLHASYVLAPLMVWFIQAAVAEHIPVPDGYDQLFVERLRETGLRRI